MWCRGCGLGGDGGRVGLLFEATMGGELLLAAWERGGYEAYL